MSLYISAAALLSAVFQPKLIMQSCSFARTAASPPHRRFRKQTVQKQELLNSSELNTGSVLGHICLEQPPQEASEVHFPADVEMGEGFC